MNEETQNSKTKLQGWDMNTLDDGAVPANVAPQPQIQHESFSTPAEPTYPRELIYSGISFLAAIISALFIFSKAFMGSSLGMVLAWGTMGTILLVPFIFGIAGIVFFIKAFISLQK